ncbi:MAG: hypothetical protein QM237_04660 [Bacteroidota bacterium]|nr:hypothetical protein [Bacteroidota bacterium]
MKTNLNEEERRKDERKIQEEMIKIYWGDPEDNRGTRLIKKITGK